MDPYEHIFYKIAFPKLCQGAVSVHLCLASPANFIYGRLLAKVLSHVTIMPVLLRPVNNFLGQVIGNASEGKYNTVNIRVSDLSKMSEIGDYPIFI